MRDVASRRGGKTPTWGISVEGILRGNRRDTHHSALLIWSNTVKKVLLTATLIAAIGTSATAQDIQPPILIAPTTEVAVGTAGPALGLSHGLIQGGMALTLMGIVAANSDDDDDDD